MDVPEIIARRYRLIRELAVGGQGGIFEVERLDTKHRYALKVMLNDGAQDPTLVARFKREANAYAKAASKHVVRVFEIGGAEELGGRLYMVMELLRGADLSQLLQRRGKFPPREVLEWMRQTGEALTTAHDVGIVHRDLKPQNLFLHTRSSGERIIKLLDFGVARLLDPEATAVTDTGAPVGTLRYIAPEQLVPGQHPVGPATDIWALGLITVELLTGVSYWKARMVRAHIDEILRGAVDPPSHRWPTVPAGFDAWFLRSCALEPPNRWPDVKTQIAALEPVLAAPTK